MGYAISPDSQDVSNRTPGINRRQDTLPRPAPVIQMRIPKPKAAHEAQQNGSVTEGHLHVKAWTSCHLGRVTGVPGEVFRGLTSLRLGTMGVV